MSSVSEAFASESYSLHMISSIQPSAHQSLGYMSNQEEFLKNKNLEEMFPLYFSDVQACSNHQLHRIVSPAEKKLHFHSQKKARV